MKSLIPLVAGGAAGMMWNVLPRWVKVPAVVGLVALAAIELNKDANESWFSSSIFGGQAAEGESKSVDPLKTEADAAAGIKPVSGAARMMANQVRSAGADALQKEVTASAASHSEQELLTKKRSGAANMTDARVIEELKKLRSEAETAQAQSTAARAQALAEKQSAEIASRLISSMNDGTLPDTLLDLSGIRGVFPDIERLNAKRR